MTPCRYTVTVPELVEVLENLKRVLDQALENDCEVEAEVEVKVETKADKKTMLNSTLGANTSTAKPVKIFCFKSINEKSWFNFCGKFILVILDFPVL